MAIELILMDNVETLGSVGDKVKVADGYARNFLLPRGLAVHASKGILKQLEARKIEIKKQEDVAIAEATELVAKIEETSVTIPVQAGDDDKLFGSITNIEIANSLNEDGFDIDKRKIVIAEPIKQLGVHEVQVKLHKDVSATLKVWAVKA